MGKKGNVAERAGNAPMGVAAGASSCAGRYLTSRLGGELFGLQISKVQEIMGLMPITRVPRMPDDVRGVIDLRGHVIPVMDLRLKLGMPPGEDTEKTCIVVVRIDHDGGAMEVGLIVDEVRDVTGFHDDQIDPAPDLGGSLDTA